MKKSLLGLAMALTLLITVAAGAQTVHLRADIPFNFTAGTVILPAGEYDLQSVGNSGSVISVQNMHSRDGGMLNSISCGSRAPSPRTRLIFHRYGGRYFLAEVWVQGQTWGREVPPTSHEKELARDFQRDEVVLAAARR